MTQAKPTEKCPVCGGSPDRNGVTFWRCHDSHHGLIGPLNDQSGEGWDAMIRKMKSRPKMTLEEMRRRLVQINKAQNDIERLSFDNMDNWVIETKTKIFKFQDLLDPGLFQARVNDYIESMRRIIADECAALGVEME